MKVPRIIEIPKNIQPIIRILYQRGQWPDERIAEFTANTLIEIQRRIETVNDNVQALVASTLPDDVDEFTLDLRQMTVKDRNSDRTWSVKDEIKQQLVYLASEGDLCREAAKLAGLPAVAIAERTQSVMGEINKIIHDNLPQCAQGEWRMDLRSMVMQEVFPDPTEER